MLRSAKLLLVPFLVLGCSPPVSTPGAKGKPWIRKDPTVKPERPRDLPDTAMSSHVVHESRERCGGRCRFVRLGESILALHLADGGVAEASDEGEMVERIRTAAWKRGQRTKWQRKWTGTWKVEDELHVKLRPVSQHCSVQADDGATDEGCALPYELHLRCELVDLALTHPRERYTRAWNCQAKVPPRATGITTFPWVFGTREPLVVLDGGSRHAPTRRYSLEPIAADATAQRGEEP
jgi:hypothetical protein